MATRYVNPLHISKIYRTGRLVGVTPGAELRIDLELVKVKPVTRQA